MFNVLRNNIPRPVKIILARKLVSFLFLQKKIINNRQTDIFLIELLLKLNDLEMVKELISDHSEDVNYCRFIEHIERYKALGKDANEIRLDFDIGKYQKVLQVNEDLIQKFPEDFLLHDRMARNFLAGGYRNKAKRSFSQSLKLQRIQRLREGKTGLIVFVTMPRSGSGFVSEALKNGLGLDDLGSTIKYVDAWFPDFGVIEFPDYIANPRFSPMPDGFFSSHAPALEPNLWNLSLITDKLVINFRDPRQALISWAHYMEYFRFTGNVSGLVEYQIPDGYFQWSFEQQLNWQIEEYFVPVNIEWINGWLRADKNPDFPCKIFFSQHEILAQDQEKYFQDFLSFYGLPEEKFTHPQKPKFKAKSHKRKGSTDEWKQILSREQVRKINALIPEAWFERFNWPIT